MFYGSFSGPSRKINLLLACGAGGHRQRALYGKGDEVSGRDIFQTGIPLDFRYRLQQ
jgi:hypothetical protein